MKRLLSEFGLLMTKRKHLLFLVAVWSVAALSLYAFSLGLGKAVDRAFHRTEPEPVEYGYKIDTPLVASEEGLTDRQSLYMELSQNPNFTYYSYLDTTGTINMVLHNKALAIGNSNAITTGDDVAQTYKVHVIFIDENAAKRTGIYDAYLKTLFEGNADYDSELPVCLGFGWSEENYSTEQVTMSIELSLLGQYPMQIKSVAPEGTRFTMGGRDMVVDNYIIIPLRDVGTPTAGVDINEQARRSFWCSIYDVKNQGIITTNMTADSLQRTINEMLKENKLATSFDIDINNADNDSKILFYDNIEGIQKNMRRISMVALFLAGVFMALYTISSINKNKKLEFMAYLNGTGKIELVFLSFIQTLIWAVATFVISYGVFYGMSRAVTLGRVDTKVIMTPVIIISVICFAIAIIRFALWDMGKIIRRI